MIIEKTPQSGAFFDIDYSGEQYRGSRKLPPLQKQCYIVPGRTSRTPVPTNSRSIYLCRGGVFPRVETMLHCSRAPHPRFTSYLPPEGKARRRSASLRRAGACSRRVKKVLHRTRTGDQWSPLRGRFKVPCRGEHCSPVQKRCYIAPEQATNIGVPRSECNELWGFPRVAPTKAFQSTL